MDDSAGEVTRLLNELQGRKQEAAPRLFELLYSQLRHMAQRHLQHERADHTLQATALVNEAYLRLAGGNQSWHNRAHFFGIAARVMRRILVDHARAKHAAKRPGAREDLNLDAVPNLTREPYDDIILIDVALKRLSDLDARKGLIVEMRYFGGLSAEESAEALGVSVITVQRDWSLAKAWLHRELAGPVPDEGR